MIAEIVIYRQEFFLVKIVLGCILFFLCSFKSYALDQFSLSLGHITHKQWQVEGIEFTFSGIFSDTQNIHLNIQSLSLPKPLDTIKLVKIMCPEAKVKDNSIECRKGFAKVQSDWLNSPRIPLNFYLSETKSRLNLGRIKIAGGSIMLKANLNNGLWQARIEAENIESSAFHKRLKLDVLENIEGKLDAFVLAKGKGKDISGLDAQISLSNINLQSRDGRIATEKLKISATFQGQKKSKTWQYDSQINFNKGAIYADPIYLESAAEPITINFSGFWQEQSKKFAIEKINAVHPNVLTINTQGQFGLNKAVNGEVNLYVKDLKAASEIYIQPLLTETALEGLDFSGQLNTQFQLVQQTLTELQLSFSQLGISDTAGRLDLENGVGHINWSKHESNPEASNFSWQKLGLFSLPVDAAELIFTAAGHSVHLNQLTKLPFLGGDVVINNFAMTLKDAQKPDISLQGAIHKVSLERMTEALNWQPLSGEISGEIPGVSYRDNKLGIDGALKIQFFDGEVTVNDLAVSGLFSHLPQFYADIKIDRLDLDQITRKFDFGSMQGRLSGTVQDLYLENWQPVTFYAWLGTPENDDSRHRISQKAVNNLASIGGGGAANVLSRTVLRFFETFGYDKVGIGCYLYEGVCQLMGVGAAEQGYYIVKGGGLPRIDVIGYNPRVDWKVLIERLGRITQTKPAN